MPLSDDTKSKVKKQVEFYFSDSNVPRDNFLLGKIEEDPEGFVDLALLCSFSRMVEALGIPRSAKKEVKVSEEKVAEVAEVLRTSDALVLSENGKRVRRAKPLASPEEVAAALDARSLYAAPFPYDATLDALTAFFADVAPVNCVRMRRHLQSKDFRGSIFIEFASEEVAKEVLGKDLEYEGAKLKLEPKLDYVQRKFEDRKAKAGQKAQAAPEKAEGDEFFAEDANGTADAPEANGEPEEAAAEAAAEPAMNGKAEQSAAEGKAEAKDADAAADMEAEPAAVAAEEEAKETEEGAEEQKEEGAVTFEPGMLLRIDFGEAEHDLSFDDIKKAFGRTMAYVEFQKGASSGIMRFKKLEEADAALGKADADGNITIADVAGTVSKVEGEEEESFYKRANAARRPDGQDGRGQKRGRDSTGGRGGRGRGGGRGGRGRGRGHKRGRH